MTKGMAVYSDDASWTEGTDGTWYILLDEEGNPLVEPLAMYEFSGVRQTIIVPGELV